MAAVLSGLATTARANDLTVDRRSVLVSESLTITVSLEDGFAEVDSINVPVKNLVVSAAPAVSSEFSWINGTVVRRKVFRFAARGIAPGPAMVGPLVISSPDGQRETLPPVALQVMPDRAAGSNDPDVVLRELLATGRDPLFVVTTVDKASARVGEEVVVTWWLYNAASVQEWQIGAIPKLAGFWTEEIDVRSVQPVEVYVDGYAMQRVPVRRVALFPLQSGTLPIGPLEVEASLLRRTSGLFGVFEGSLAQVSYASAPVDLNVAPLPAEASNAVIGDLVLICGKPVQRNGGPIVMNVTLSGRGNVRAAAAPQFERSPAAAVQRIDRGVTVDKNADVPSMTRRWEYLLFPERAGSLTIPPMSVKTFSPGDGTVRMLRCQATQLVAAAAAPETPRSSARPLPSKGDVLWWGLIAGAAAAGLTMLIFMGRLLARMWSSRRDIRSLIAGRTPEQIRDAVQERIAAAGRDPLTLLHEPSERGDAWRSLRSLLDATEQDRIRFDAREIRARVRDLLTCLQSAR